jgi:hypothetical protein
MMIIRRIRPNSAAQVRIRVAALMAVPALAAGGLLAIGNPVAEAAPAAACGITTIVTNINAIGDQADVANQILGGLSTTSPPYQVFDAQSTLSAQLNDLSSALAGYANDLSGCAPLSAADAQTAAQAFSNAASSITSLLSTISSKHNIFAQYGVTAPIASGLRQFEGAFDQYAYTLADVATSQAGSISSSQNQVDTALGNAINLYQQLCIPSPLYPTIMPVCIST